MVAGTLESRNAAVQNPHAGLPLLRTLVPAMRDLHKLLRDWIDQPHRAPLDSLTRSAMIAIRDDLIRKADDLDNDQPFLAIVLMGGTGVGKSTLLNALAGGSIAQASFTRPTTRDPVVYHHQSLKVDRLAPALRACRLVSHDREELRDKVIVDTPDLDSNEEANRERLMGVLPVADVVLYVGSQEKYHDRLGWDIFRAQRQRRAFAFVLNKWDRCNHAGQSGVRPDEDLLRDLKSEGFADPLLFRTSAQVWVDRDAGKTNISIPEGEQFSELVNWLEDGLTRMEVEALKARGVEQLLDDMAATLNVARPADIDQPAAATKPVWEDTLNQEAPELADLLLQSLEPRQREIEHHFRVTGQQKFQSLMAGYLGIITWIQYTGSRLRNPATVIVGESSHGVRSWDVPALSRECIAGATRRGLTQRIQALSNRLVVAANAEGMPTEIMLPRVQELADLDWRGQFESALRESLGTVERGWTNPTGARRVFRSLLVLLANYVPQLTLIASILILLWNWFMVTDYHVTLGSVLIPFVLTLFVLILFHMAIHICLPLRWPAIRGDFRRYLRREIADRLKSAFVPIPASVAAEVANERKAIDDMAKRVNELQKFLRSRRQATSVDAMYGSKTQMVR
jgi:hypothetical protein